MAPSLTPRKLIAVAVPAALGLAALTPISATAAGATRVAGTITSISVTAPASVPVGAFEVPVASIPTSVLGDGAGADGTPVRGVPVRGVPVRGVPVRGVPVRGVPVRGVPVRGVPVRGVPVRGVPVRGVPLSQIPLLPASGKTWPALVAAIPALANKPLATISFGDYLDAAPNTDLTLGDIDLANSPLRAVPLEGWLLATVPASQIVYPGGSLCDLAKRQTGIAQCDATIVNSIAYDYSPAVPTVLDLALAGIDFTSVPWARVPLAQISSDAPIRSIVLGGANGGTVSNSALGTLVLSGLNYDKTTSLSTFSQTTSLGSQQATFDQQAAANKAIKIGDLSLYNPAIQATDAETLGVRPTVADAMSTLIDSTTANWESANLSGLNLPEYDSAQSPGTWTASVTATAVSGSPAGSVVPTTITLTLPDGFDALTTSVLANGAALTPNSVKRDGPKAVVDVDAPSGVPMSLTFTALGPLDLRTTGTASSLTAAPFGGALATTTSGATTVVARTAVHNALTPNVLTFDYITSSATDTTKSFTVKALPAGTRMFALLGNLPADYDMTVYGPPVVGAGKVASSPFASLAQSAFVQRPALGLNLSGGLKSDPGVDNGPGTAAPVSGQIAEIPLHQGTNNLPVVGVSNTVGTGSEEVGWISEGYDSYTVIVSAKSGASSPKPFTLRIRSMAPPAAAVCKPGTAFGTAVTYPATAIDLVAPPNPAPNSPIAVIDRVAFQARYGAAATTAMWNSLVAFRTLPEGLPLRFVLLDTDPAYAAAAQQRMVNPCDLQPTFTEVDRIGSLIRAAKTANPTATSVIMVGSDEQVPMARVRDQAWTFNEAEFADEAVDGTPNPISVSAQQGFVLSDTPYAISTPSLAGQEALMLPDMGIGRLVESPATIQGLLDNYTKNAGQLYVTKKGFSYQRYGYGFLADGTNAMGASFAAGTGIEAAGSVVNDSWDGSALTGTSGAFSATGAAAATVLNAHFDPRRLLAACGDPIVTPAPSCLTPLVGTAAAIAPSLPGKLLMSVGCHSGLNIPNGYVPGNSPLATDWAETFANQGASVWVGNTGYGYGDSDVVGYSEQLMTNFADQLTQAPNAGLALAYAKQQYQGGLSALSDIDLKVMAESTLYGLPLWVGLNPNRTPVAKVTRALTGSSTGYTYADLTNITPTLTSVASPRGTYYTASAAGAVATVAATPGMPLTPHLDLPFTQANPSIVNSRIHGVEVVSLTGTAPTAEDPVISRAVVDSSVREGEPAAPNTVWPASIQTASWMTTAVGDEDRVGISPTVTFPRAPEGLTQLVDREKFTLIGVRAYYSSSARLIPPVIQRIDVAGTALTVTAVKSDAVVIGADTPPIDHVSVLGWDGVSAGGWTKYGPTAGLGPTFGYTISANTKYLYVQVVDQAGDVSSAWKVITPAITGTAAGTASVSGPAVAGSPGKFTGPATITASWPSGAHIKLGTTGAVDSPNPATVFSTQNAYLVDGYNAVQKAWSFTIDSTPPALPVAAAGQVIAPDGGTVIVPASAPTATAGGTVVNFPTTTTDAGDGTVPFTCLPASGSSFPIGSSKVGCQAVDSAGNRTYTTFTVTVQDPYITVPAPITAEATGPTGATVTYTATATDSVDGARPVSCTPASGSTFAIATTAVTCTSQDTRGYVSTSTFTVTVRDTTAPALALPASVAATATSASGAVVTYAATATDKVDGARPITCTPASGSTFAVGATTVSCSSADTRLNTATGSFVVTVAKAADTTAPTVTFSPVSGTKVSCVKTLCPTTTLKFATADSSANSTWQNVSGLKTVTYYTTTTASTVTTTPLFSGKGVAYPTTGGSVTLTNTLGNKIWVRVDAVDAAGILTTAIWWVSA